MKKDSITKNVFIYHLAQGAKLAYYSFILTIYLIIPWVSIQKTSVSEGVIFINWIIIISIGGTFFLFIYKLSKLMKKFDENLIAKLKIKRKFDNTRKMVFEIIYTTIRFIALITGIYIFFNTKPEFEIGNWYSEFELKKLTIFLKYIMSFLPFAAAVLINGVIHLVRANMESKAKFGAKFILYIDESDIYFHPNILDLPYQELSGLMMKLKRKRFLLNLRSSEKVLFLQKEKIK